MSRVDLSTEAKQTFQVVGLLATLLVIGIHYKSDIPDSPVLAESTSNELWQDYLFGGLARVAVPIFAFAAGLFYFRSGDNSLRSHRSKLAKRTRTLLVPYLLVGAIATTCWLLVNTIEGTPVQLNWLGYLSVWLLHPPAEQLWFLRDLFFLVLLAPAIHWCVSHHKIGNWFVGAVLLIWMLEWQPFPIVQGWYLINIETFTFFVFGCFATRHYWAFESIGRQPLKGVTLLTAGWLLLVLIRVLSRPDFDIWYSRNCGVIDLLAHKTSILIGCVALFQISWRLRSKWVLYWSSASFFVYLIHEFPLRAAIEKVCEKFVPVEYTLWPTLPMVIIVCFGAAYVMNRYAPFFTGLLSGGRVLPASNKKIPPAESPQITKQATR